MAGPSKKRRAKLGEARGCAKQADSRYAVAMKSSAAFAPHLGAALAAGLLVATGLAFRAGAEGGAVDGTARPGASAAAQSESGIMAQNHELVAEPSPYESADPGFDQGPMLAVIIDDIGLDRAAAGRLIGLDLPLTLSILPYAQAAPEIAEAARAGGKDVFLHLPMEPVGLDDPGPLALTRHQSGDALVQRAHWALSRVPGASGFNNHMGSGLTADADAMDALFAPFADQGLIFVDSLTSPDSVAQGRAAAAGLSAMRRDVFLDHDRDPAAVSAALDLALQTARENGFAVAIGHPHRVTLEALGTLQARAALEGVVLVTMSQLDASLSSRGRRS